MDVTMDKNTRWPLVRLGDVCEIKNGKNQKEVESPIGKYPIFGSAGKVMGYATEYICEPGTTIIGRKGTIDNPIYVEEKFWNVDTAFGFSAKSKLNKRYLYYFCLSFDFKKLNRGTTLPSLVKSELLEIPLPLPPLAEQQRIVARLDAAFAAIAEASAAAEVNLRNARALFDSYLDQVFSTRGAGWVERRLPDISENQDSRRKPVTRNLRNNGEYPYFGASGVVDYVDDYIFEENNLLISEDGANLLARSTPIAFTVEGKYWVNNHAHVLHFTDADLQKFIEFYFAHIDIAEYVTGAAQPKLTQKALNNIPVFHPTNPETLIKLVEGMEFINNESKGLCDVYKQKLAALAELKQSLLAEVFGVGE
jgi:type I restriction enzyme S subunit